MLLGGLSLYVLFLVIQMPAVWLAGQLPEEGALRLRQVDGTLWRGSAGQVIWNAGSDSLNLGQLRWSLRPGEWLQGGIGVALELGHAPKVLTGQVRYGADGLYLTSVQGQFDAPVLGFATRALSLLQPQGILAVDIASLHLTGNRVHGAARVDWREARSGLVAAPLGDYRVELRAEPDGRRARINVQTLQGALAINGDGDYTPGKGVQGRLTLVPPQGERRALYSPVLNMLGMPDATGAWVLNLDAR